MSSEDFGKKADKLRKQLNILRKDINYRDEQEKRGEATYQLDAQINGQFTQITDTLNTLETVVTNFRNNYRDYNITISEANKRHKVFEQLLNDKNTLKRNYDALFARKTNQRELTAQLHGNETFDAKHDTKNLTSADLQRIRAKQDEEQDEALEELINNVKGLKGGQHAIKDELVEQEQLLGTLDDKMDGNIGHMSSARRRLGKLLESSSNCCLISVMIVEIALVIVIWVLL